MRRRLRIVLIVTGWVLELVFGIGIGTVLLLRSDWFLNQVRLRIIREVENATGGRAQIGSFRFHWRALRAEVRNFVLHGNEPAGDPPLLRADVVSVGLKIVSLVKRDIDIEALDVTHPQVYLIIRPNGRTNIPEPRVRRTRDRTAMETFLNLAIGRFSLTNGVIEVKANGRTPFDARGRNLRAVLQYQPAGPRYQGEIEVQPLDIRYGRYGPVAFQLRVSPLLGRDR